MYFLYSERKNRTILQNSKDEILVGMRTALLCKKYEDKKFRKLKA
jgi:hypothetical protein